MGKNSHVVDFSSKSESAQEKALNPLPVLVKEAMQVSLKRFDSSLHKMFEKADDYLFDMSDSSYSNKHFDAMRLLRLKKDGLLRQFQTELKSVFAEHLGKVQTTEDSLSSSENMSFENIALVEDSDLEEGIAIDTMVKKARGSNVEQLEKIRTRLDALITNRTISRENNPFEPAFICAAFKNASVTLDIDIESLLIIYKLFERMVLSEIHQVYSEVNQFFIDKGVLPELKVVGHQAAYKNDNTTAYQDEDLTSFEQLFENSVSNEQSDQHTSQQPSHQSAYQSEGEQLVGLMQNLLAQNRSRASGGTQTSAYQSQSNSQVAGQQQNQASGKPLDTIDLVKALTQIQVQPTSQHRQSGEVLVDVKQLLNSQLNYDESGTQASNSHALGQFNEDMIDIVSMLFDFILDDKNVHSQIKSIIARLQIPMLKVGLVDRSFFSNKKHSARILLNEIARAGISWDPNDKDAQKMLDKIESISDEIINNFNDDLSIFERLLADFNEFRDSVQRRADIFERRTREAEEGKAKAESARGAVNAALEKICINKHVPAPVADILKQVWVNVLFLEKLKGDQEGWDRALQVAKLLVWSVQPIASASALEKLLSKIPVLVKNLRKGFDIISLSPIDGTRLLEALESTHRDLIKETQEKLESNKEEEILRLAPAPLIPEAKSADMPQSNANESAEVSNQKDELDSIETIEITDIGFSPEQTGEALKKSIPDDAVSDASIQAVQRLNAGHWVELEIEGEISRCKLAAKIASTDKFIFVNRSGIKIAEYYLNNLAQAYQTGKLKILDEEALFDRALESVISNLRAMKAEA